MVTSRDWERWELASVRRKVEERDRDRGGAVSKPERPWVRMLPGQGDGHLHGLCLGCSERFIVGLPAPIGVVPKIIDLYLREHRHCGGAWRKRGSPESV